jgi:hypothetical protein
MANQANGQGRVGRLGGISLVLGESRIEKAREPPPAGRLQYRHPTICRCDYGVVLRMRIEHHRPVVRGNALPKPSEKAAGAAAIDADLGDRACPLPGRLFGPLVLDLLHCRDLELQQMERRSARLIIGNNGSLNKYESAERSNGAIASGSMPSLI